MSEAQRKLIEDLKAGKVVEGYREGGNSMTPKIKSRQPVTVTPLALYLEAGGSLSRGTIVFAKVGGRCVMHLISSIRDGGERFQISNNHGYVNGWTSRANVFGVVTKVHPMP